MKESSGSFQYESQRAGGKEKAEQRLRFRVSFLRVLRIFRTPILCHCPCVSLRAGGGGTEGSPQVELHPGLISLESASVQVTF